MSMVEYTPACSSSRPSIRPLMFSIITPHAGLVSRKNQEVNKSLAEMKGASGSAAKFFFLFLHPIHVDVTHADVQNLVLLAQQSNPSLIQKPKEPLPVEWHPRKAWDRTKMPAFHLHGAYCSCFVHHVVNHVECMSVSHHMRHWHQQMPALFRSFNKCHNFEDVFLRIYYCNPRFHPELWQ